MSIFPLLRQQTRPTTTRKGSNKVTTIGLLLEIYSAPNLNRSLKIENFYPIYIWLGIVKNCERELIKCLINEARIEIS